MLCISSIIYCFLIGFEVEILHNRTTRLSIPFFDVSKFNVSDFLMLAKILYLHKRLHYIIKICKNYEFEYCSKYWTDVHVLLL